MTDPVTPPPAPPEPRAWPPVEPTDGATERTRQQPNEDTRHDTQQDTQQDTKEQAKQEAADLKDTTASAAQDVAETAKGQAQNVATEVGQQTRNLASQATSELSGQANNQQQRLAANVRSYAGELRSMADGSDQTGMVSDIAHQLADRGEQVAGWMADRKPKDLLDEVKSFARRRPVAFLAIAAGAGIVAGRLSRGLFADAKGGDPALSSTDASRSPATPSRREVEQNSPARSLQEVPTSGSGAGPTYDQPLVADPNLGRGDVIR